MSAGGSEARVEDLASRTRARPVPDVREEGSQREAGRFEMKKRVCFVVEFRFETSMEETVDIEGQDARCQKVEEEIRETLESVIRGDAFNVEGSIFDGASVSDFIADDDFVVVDGLLKTREGGS
jgi:hypothetical protein